MLDDWFYIVYVERSIPYELKRKKENQSKKIGKNR